MWLVNFNKDSLLNWECLLFGLRNPDPEQRLSLAAAASKINKEVDSLAKSKDKPNIIWDTTANNPTKVKELQDAGYDVLMIMVYAHPSVAFEQNFARASKEGEAAKKEDKAKGKEQVTEKKQP